MTLKLKRIEVCDLLIACTEAYSASEAEKWIDLHDKLLAMIDSFDKENNFGVYMEF